MIREELISNEIDKYTDLLRIIEAREDWETEANNQLRKVRAKLESFAVAVDPLTNDAAHPRS